MAIITVPKTLRDKLGEEGSDALINMINHSQDNQKTDIIERMGEKFERRLSEEIADRIANGTLSDNKMCPSTIKTAS